MMKYHKDITLEKWQLLPLKNQIMNIGAEISRVQTWQNLEDKEKVKECVERALELLDLTLRDKRWKNKLGELLRIREALCYFYAYESAPIISKIFLDWLFQFAQEN